ncbi:hypothetical protein KQX54_019977 [Cotesia glomerata]|uniref:Uncharacterized protein n=1 Tax=Cotesia glomerata TaxID=32391 RepID=A0AAV7IH52_COTGL|nr:hypothetical protein KQX54_019977 [Cotesia glomerata]
MEGSCTAKQSQVRRIKGVEEDGIAVQSLEKCGLLVELAALQFTVSKCRPIIHFTQVHVSLTRTPPTSCPTWVASASCRFIAFIWEFTTHSSTIHYATYNATLHCRTIIHTGLHETKLDYITPPDHL